MTPRNIPARTVQHLIGRVVVELALIGTAVIGTVAVALTGAVIFIVVSP